MPAEAKQQARDVGESMQGTVRAMHLHGTPNPDVKQPIQDDTVKAIDKLNKEEYNGTYSHINNSQYGNNGIDTVQQQAEVENK
jgi:hypothetical protein